MNPPEIASGLASESQQSEGGHYQQTVDETLTALGTNQQGGLSSDEARAGSSDTAKTN